MLLLAIFAFFLTSKYSLGFFHISWQRLQLRPKHYTHYHGPQVHLKTEIGIVPEYCLAGPLFPTTSPTKRRTQMYELITKNHESGQIMQSMPGSEEKMPDRSYSQLCLCNVRP
jgi:hypothetical protein